MPIYEYRCDQCGDIFEEWQKFSDPVIDKCPSCGGHASRLISQSTFILKGSGWYVTDWIFELVDHESTLIRLGYFYGPT